MITAWRSYGKAQGSNGAQRQQQGPGNVKAKLPVRAMQGKHGPTICYPTNLVGYKLWGCEVNARLKWRWCQIAAAKGSRECRLVPLSSRVKLAFMDAIDHRVAITNLEPALRRSLIERSDGPGLWQFGFHLGAILVLGILIALRAPLWFLLLPVHGILIVFLFTALHECTHETAFKSSFLNTAI